MPRSEEMQWICPNCGSSLDLAPIATTSAADLDHRRSVPIHNAGPQTDYAHACANCTLPVCVSSVDGAQTIKYPYRLLASRHSWKRFVSWSLAQNNGYISYSHLRSASCSDGDNAGALSFGDFIAASGRVKGRLLDVGCGPMRRPVYLEPVASSIEVAIGIDPFPTEWEGHRIEGIAEWIPIPSSTIDTLVAATTVDHFFDLSKGLRELARVIRPGGTLLLWDHAGSPPSKNGWVSGVRARMTQVVRGAEEVMANGRRVRVYSNGVVLPTPLGYADPFHEPNSRRASWSGRLRVALQGLGLRLIEEEPNQGFSAWIRG